MLELYVASTYSPARETGGWGIKVVEEGRQLKREKGSEKGATHNAMILKAAIEGLSKIDEGSEVKLLSNSEYLIIGIKDARQRKGNRELWEQLDKVANRRHVYPDYIAKHKWLGEAQMLARDAVRG